LLHGAPAVLARRGLNSQRSLQTNPVRAATTARSETTTWSSLRRG
jgi:hypothetical protein